MPIEKIKIAIAAAIVIAIYFLAATLLFREQVRARAVQQYECPLCGK